MKPRVLKKRIRRNAMWFAKNKIPMAFSGRKDMIGWANDIVRNHPLIRGKKNDAVRKNP